MRWQCWKRASLKSSIDSPFYPVPIDILYE